MSVLFGMVSGLPQHGDVAVGARPVNVPDKPVKNAGNIVRTRTRFRMPLETKGRGIIQLDTLQ